MSFLQIRITVLIIFSVVIALGVKMRSSAAWMKMLKIGSLLFLTLQNAVLVLFMRYARTRSGDMFVASTAVVVAEVFKVVLCLVVILYENKMNLRAFLIYLLSNTIHQPLDCLKISVPAVVYMLQNNLLYVALSNLDTSVFQVTYQLKILTTAIFSVVILRKQLSRFQWLALVMLTLGVGVVQMQVYDQRNAKSSSPIGEKLTRDVSSPVPIASQQNATIGIAAVLIACLMSGFAGVYYEKLLKHTSPSIFLRNVQLGVIGIVFGIIAVFYSDGQKVIENGFLHGYDASVWFIVILQSLGGLLVAIVIKYADNIQKGFATSAAIVVTCVVSVFLFGTNLSLQFCFGATLVIASIYVYGRFIFIPLTK